VIKLLYFASLRETLGVAGEELALPAAVATVAALRGHLATRGEPWTVLTRSQSLRCAVNQALVGADAGIGDGDEIAFFPPVTGG